MKMRVAVAALLGAACLAARCGITRPRTSRRCVTARATTCPTPTWPPTWLSPSTKAGAKSGTLFNHFSLLATTEQLLGLAKLGQAASAATMTKAFNL